MNSTRTWVTPPREPINPPFISKDFLPLPGQTTLPRLLKNASTGRGILQDNIVPVRPRTRVTLTSLTGALEESILCSNGKLGDVLEAVVRLQRCGAVVEVEIGLDGTGQDWGFLSIVGFTFLCLSQGFPLIVVGIWWDNHVLIRKGSRPR